MKKGYTILVIILVLIAVGILIITTLGLLAIDEMKMSISQRDSTIGFYLSTACAEEALLRIRNNSDYTTRGVTVPIDLARGYYCWFKVVNPKPPKYIYTASRVTNLNYPRKLEIRVDKIDPSTKKIIIGYWLEK
ncbi:MAG: hypothetical protein ACK413_01705 [Patescibacteria group bacterium]